MVIACLAMGCLFLFFVRLFWDHISEGLSVIVASLWYVMRWLVFLER